jgi:hypothetical protein
VFVFPYVEKDSERDRKPDITEIEQIKQIVFCEPERNGNRLENDQHPQRQQVLFQNDT